MLAAQIDVAVQTEVAAGTEAAARTAAAARDESMTWPAGAALDDSATWAGRVSPNGAGCQPEGLRERKKLATRRALAFAAMRLAVERGIDNVLVEEIAAEVGVSARTFNNYFGSKYEAICALAMDRGRQIGVALRNRPADEPLMDAITSAVLEPYAPGAPAPDKDWIEGVRLVVQSPALQGEYLRTHYVMQQALAEAIADRIGADLRTDMFPAVMAGAVTAATQVAIERWLRTDPPTPLVPLIKLALSQLASPSVGWRHADGEFTCHPEPSPRS